MDKIFKYHLWIMLTPIGTEGLSSPFLRLFIFLRTRKKNVIIRNAHFQRWGKVNECSLDPPPAPEHWCQTSCCQSLICTIVIRGDSGLTLGIDVSKESLSFRQWRLSAGLSKHVNNTSALHCLQAKSGFGRCRILLPAIYLKKYNLLHKNYLILEL